MTKGFGKVAKLGDQEPLYAASIILGLCGLVLTDRRLVHDGLRVGAAVAVSDVLKSVTKKLVMRSRPKSVVAGHDYRREGAVPTRRPSNLFRQGTWRRHWRPAEPCVVSIPGLVL